MEYDITQVTGKFIVYKVKNGIEQPAGVAHLSSFQGDWYLGLLVEGFEDYFDYTKYSARIIDKDLAYGALFYKKCDRDGTGLYIKTPFEPGEKPEWGYIIGSSKGYDQATKYYANEQDLILGGNFHKLIMRLHALDIFQQRFESLTINRNSVETSTWPAQKAEALAFTSDTSAYTPTLNTLAEARGLTVGELVIKVLEKSAKYDAEIASLLAQQQIVIDKINLAVTVEDCNVVCEELFGLAMPMQQALRLGLCVDGDMYTRKIPIKDGIQF